MPKVIINLALLIVLTLTFSGCSYVNQAKQDASDFVNNTESAITETTDQIVELQNTVQNKIEKSQQAAKKLQEASELIQEVTK